MKIKWTEGTVADPDLEMKGVGGGHCCGKPKVRFGIIFCCYRLDGKTLIILIKLRELMKELYNSLGEEECVKSQLAEARCEQKFPILYLVNKRLVKNSRLSIRCERTSCDLKYKWVVRNIRPEDTTKFVMNDKDLRHDKETKEAQLRSGYKINYSKSINYMFKWK